MRTAVATAAAATTTTVLLWLPFGCWKLADLCGDIFHDGDRDPREHGIVEIKVRKEHATEASDGNGLAFVNLFSTQEEFILICKVVLEPSPDLLRITRVA